MTTTRNDGRAVTDLREIKITRNWLDHAGLPELDVLFAIPI
jgi:ribonuclease PH